MGVSVECCPNCGYFYFDEYTNLHYDDYENIIYKCEKSTLNVSKLCNVWYEVIRFRYLSRNVYYYDLQQFNENLEKLRKNIDDDKVIEPLIEYFKKCYY